MNKLKMFCLPYSCGSKTIYSDWISRYSDVAEVIPVEYSGHGSRFTEELYNDAQKISDDVVKTIISEAPSNYVVYGHSMGCLIAYLTALKLSSRYKYPPKAVIIGGTRPPHLKYKDERLSGYSKEKIIEKMIELGQMDEEILKDPELMDILSDIFIADISAGENFEQDEIKTINIPMFVGTGLQDDEAPAEDMGEWKKYTTSLFLLKCFDDSHFFPFNCPEYPSYLKKVLRDIAKYC